MGLVGLEVLSEWLTEACFKGMTKMMKRGMWRYGLAAVLACVVLGLVLPMSGEPLSNGTEAPKWTLTGLDDKEVTSEKLYKDKVVVLNFWATWCPPCVKEIPDFVELQKEYKDKDLLFIGISLDRGAGNVQKVKDFVEKNGMNYPVVMGNTGVTQKYGNITGIPTTYVIDKEGVIRFSKVGLISKNDMEKAFKALL